MEEPVSNQPIIDAVGMDVLSSRYRTVQIPSVDWQIHAGEYWVVGGPHGSGKTDLMMTATGLHRPGSGSLRIFGRDLANLSEHEILPVRKRLGFVFKGGGRMFPELTVEENVALGLCYHQGCKTDQAVKEVRALLELTGLSEIAAENAHTLGFEWQQRVGLARALALKPEVMFFDEPATGLGGRHRLWWTDFLEKLSKGEIGRDGKPTTIIVATSDFDLWPAAGRRCALVKDKQWRILDQRGESEMRQTMSNLL